jgi:hypothetical protein
LPNNQQNNIPNMNQWEVKDTVSSRVREVIAGDKRIFIERETALKNMNNLAKKYRLDEFKAEMEALKEGSEERIKKEEEYNALKKKAEDEAYKIAARHREQEYARAAELEQEACEQKKKHLDEQANHAYRLLQKEYRDRIKVLEEIEAHGDKLTKEQQDQKKEYAKEIIDLYARQGVITAAGDNVPKRSVGDRVASKYQREASKLDEDITKEKQKQKKLEQAISKETDETVKARLEKEQEASEIQEQKLKSDKKYAEQMADLASKLTPANALKQLSGAALSTITRAFNNEIESAISLITDNEQRVNARLLGTNLKMSTAIDDISGTLAFSPIIKSKEVIQNLQTLTDLGVTYNLEQRAYLATIADKVAAGFNATSDSLLRIIRLQQADTTAVRLGINTALTSLFNRAFQDTSYLGQVSESITGALLEATSQMSRDDSIAFEYVVQKWLGSLYSVGLSSEAAQRIAQGITYLSTGNVSALAGDTPLQTLFAMSASKAGLDYADLLTQGLNASEANSLLKSMVSYLKSINETSQNQVIRSAYSNIFGLNVSDLRAISNLTSAEISNISSSTANYNQLTNAAQSSLASLLIRTSLPTMLGIASENSMFSMGSTVATNPLLFGGYKLTQLLNIITGDQDISIPSFGFFGTYVDLEAKVGQLLSAALLSRAAFASLPKMLGALRNVGGVSLFPFEFSAYTQRGGIAGPTPGLINKSTSGSTYVANASGSDTEVSITKQGMEKAKEQKEIASEESKPEYDFERFYKNVVESREQAVTTYDILFQKWAVEQFNPAVVGGVPAQGESILGNSTIIKNFLNNTLSPTIEASEKYLNVNIANKTMARAIAVTDSNLFNMGSFFKEGMESLPIQIRDISDHIGNNLPVKVKNATIAIKGKVGVVSLPTIPKGSDKYPYFVKLTNAKDIQSTIKATPKINISAKELIKALGDVELFKMYSVYSKDAIPIKLSDFLKDIYNSLRGPEGDESIISKLNYIGDNTKYVANTVINQGSATSSRIRITDR